MNAIIRRKKSGKIIIRRLTAPKLWLNSILLILAFLTIWGFATIDTKGVDLVEAGKDTARYVSLMFSQPMGVPSHFEASENTFPSMMFRAFELLMVTLALAFLTTLIGAVIALVLGLFAARNLTSTRVSNTIKGAIAVIRAVPTVLWVLIFAIGAGLGSVAAVIGMSFHTVGYLLKAYSESFEELDEGVIEALRSSGATWPQIIFQAVLPSTASYLLSWTFIRFEINFAVAVAMGAAAGAGGIGYQLFMGRRLLF